MRQLVAACLLIASCGPTTGIAVSFSAPAGISSAAASIASLEVRTAAESFCGRYVEDATVRAIVDVSRRELGNDPYRVLVSPPHVFDIANENVNVLGIARDAGGKIIGYTGTGPQRFTLHELREFNEPLTMLQRPDAASYVADDGGCACFPGDSWFGNGSGMGCDQRVIPSFARVIDTVGCDLPPAVANGYPICDGHLYDETPMRQVPCFAPRPDGLCAIGMRMCQDENGVAYADECVPGTSATALTPTRACDAYAAASKQACSDLVGGFVNQLAPTRPLLTINCTLYVDVSSPDVGPQVPCGDQSALLPVNATACSAVMLDGIQQRPFTAGFVDTAVAGPQAVGPCPAKLIVGETNLEGPGQRTVTHRLRILIGDHLYEIALDIVKGCPVGPALVCG